MTHTGRNYAMLPSPQAKHSWGWSLCSMVCRGRDSQTDKFSGLAINLKQECLVSHFLQLVQVLKLFFPLLFELGQRELCWNNNCQGVGWSSAFVRAGTGERFFGVWTWVWALWINLSWGLLKRTSSDSCGDSCLAALGLFCTHNFFSITMGMIMLQRIS